MSAHLPDTRLIDAADDLLEALKDLASYGCPACNGDCAAANPPVCSCPIQGALAAIAKAEPAISATKAGT